MPSAGPKIALHSAPKILGLPDIDYRAPAISHEITARAIRNGLKPLSQKVGQASGQFLGGIFRLLLSLFLVGFLVSFGKALLELVLRTAKRLGEPGNLFGAAKKNESNDDANDKLPRTKILNETQKHLFSSFVL
jgi:predicted PurR-regulated permease PerM